MFFFFLLWKDWSNVIRIIIVFNLLVVYEFNLGYYFYIFLYVSGLIIFMCINRINKEFLFLVLYIYNIKSFISKYEEDFFKVKD